jgi:hypothetical protein
MFECSGSKAAPTDPTKAASLMLSNMSLRMASPRVTIHAAAVVLRPHYVLPAKKEYHPAMKQSGSRFRK